MNNKSLSKEKLDQLAKLVDALDAQVSAKDFEEAFTLLMGVVADARDLLGKRADDLESKIIAGFKDLEKKNADDISAGTSTIAKEVASVLASLRKTTEAAIKKAEKAAKHAESITAPEVDYSTVEKMLPKQKIYTPTELRDLLESLTGDERVDISAIKGVQEWLNKELEKIPKTRGGKIISGSRKVIVQEEDGSHFSYAGSLKFPNGSLSINDDGTVSVNITSGVSDHGALTGLADDDHPQYQLRTEKGAANGYAELDGTGKVPAAQLPSYVDDVLEYANLAALPMTGTTGIIYVTLDTNKTYRWSGSAYVEISSSPVTSVFGRTGVVTAQSGDYDTSLVADTTNKRYVTDAQLVVLGNTTGTNSGDQTSIVGITGTKAQFDAAVTDGNFLYVGDITQYTDEMAQDAIGAMIDSSLVYVDGTPLLQRAALTGDVTASAGSNSLTIANDAVTFAKMQNSSAASVLLGRGAGSGAGDFQEITLGSGLTLTGTVLSASGGGGGTPGGTNKQIQFNNSGSFGGMVLEYSLSGINPTLTIPDQTTADTDGPNLTVQGARGKGTGTGSTITLNGGNDELDANYGGIIYIGGGVPLGVGGELSFVGGQGVYNGGKIQFTAGNASDPTGVGGDLLFGAGMGPTQNGRFGIIQPGTTNKAYFENGSIGADRVYNMPDVSGDMATVTANGAGNIFFGTSTNGELSSNVNFKYTLAAGELSIGNHTGSFNGSMTGGYFGAAKGMAFVEDIADYNAGTYAKAYAAIQTDANITKLMLAGSATMGSIVAESNASSTTLDLYGPSGGVINLNADANTVFGNSGLFGIYNNGATRTGYFDMGALTGAANRVFAFPDQSGKVALTANPTDITVPTEAYGAGWSGSAEVPTKGDLYTKIQSMGGGSGITRSVNSISMDTSAGATALTDYVYFCTAGLTLTLPTAAGNTNTYTITRTGTATVYVTTTGGELIYGSNTVSGDSTLEMVDRYSQLTLYSDGSNWYY